MNLHEECLLKYLMNSYNLTTSTDTLLRCNRLIEKKFNTQNVAKMARLNYTYNR